MLHVFLSKQSPMKIRYPMFWAVLLGFVIQLLFGFFATFVIFVVLAAADPDYVPFAAPLRPFFGYIGGAVLATMCFEWCLLWGVFFDVDNPRLADPFLLSRGWYNWPRRPLKWSKGRRL